MKGNEARIVFFLHPVKESKEGQVSKANPKSILPRPRSILLILGTILALGVLGYVLYQFTNKPFTRVEVFSTTANPPETSSHETDAPITINNTHAATLTPTITSEALPTKSTESTTAITTTKEDTEVTTSYSKTTTVV